MKNRSVAQRIEDMLTCFRFQEDVSCQYDPVRVIQEKGKKLKRGTYEHRCTFEMEKLANKFTYSDEDKYSEEVEAMEITVLTKEEEIKKGKMKDTRSPQLINALDKDTQLMRIAVIQPPKAGDMPTEKIIEFKLNMGQFSVIDKVDMFKQTSEIICFDLISTSVSKDKLQRDFKRLENRLKTESAEKKALLIKKL